MCRSSELRRHSRGAIRTEVSMTEDELEIGDEVQHKTGKIKMIYIGKHQYGDALCEWTDPNGKPQRDTFAYAALKKYEKPRTQVFSVGRA